ncbi:hypothetical protein B9J78_02460 [bacterium Unc6]|nr:hypothetical protein [bacterium Unc6]
MSKRDWKLFLEDVLESMGLIEGYVKDMNFDNFKSDRKTIDAVIRNLEIIGEASKNIPQNMRDAYKDIDWKGIIGLRNRISHEYFGIDFSVIWNIIKLELPAFKEKFQRIQKEIEP